MERSTEGDVVFRRYRPEDAGRTLAILQAAYGRWPNFDIPVEPIDHLRWQLESPDVRATANYVAEVAGEVASVHLGYARPAWVRGVTALLWFGSDSATAPGFQGQGLFGKLRAYRVADSFQSFDLMATNPVNPTVAHEFGRDARAVELANGPRAYQRVLDARRLAGLPGGSGLKGNRLVRRLAYTGLQWLGALRSGSRRRPADGWQVRRVERFDERVDAFWEEARAAFDFIMERRRDFLNWRYCDARGGEHAVLLAEEGSRILGYAVLRLSGGRGHIVDLLALPGRADVVASLVDAAVEHFRHAGAAEARFWNVRSHPYNAVLVRAGFVYTRQWMHFFCTAMRLPPEKLGFLQRTGASVHLTDGDMV